MKESWAGAKGESGCTRAASVQLTGPRGGDEEMDVVEVACNEGRSYLESYGVVNVLDKLIKSHTNCVTPNGVV